MKVEKVIRGSGCFSMMAVAAGKGKVKMTSSLSYFFKFVLPETKTTD